MVITAEQYQEAATLLGCKVAAVKAVAKKESNGSGFLPSGKLKILFEGHHFYKRCENPKGWYVVYPTICYPVWTKKNYLGGEAEYKRFNTAFNLDPTAAMLSTSWGAFQIMGFNFSAAGYQSVNEMIDDFKKGEYQQLLGFCRFLKSNGIHKYLQGDKPKFALFAAAYNGPAFKQNKYDTILEGYFDEFDNV